MPHSQHTTRKYNILRENSVVQISNYSQSHYRCRSFVYAFSLSLSHSLAKLFLYQKLFRTIAKYISPMIYSCMWIISGKVYRADVSIILIIRIHSIFIHPCLWIESIHRNSYMLLWQRFRFLISFLTLIIDDLSSISSSQMYSIWYTHKTFILKHSHKSHDFERSREKSLIQSHM